MFGIPTIPVVTKTLTTATPSVTLYYASPGGTPRHLVVRVNGQTGRAGNRDTVLIEINGDSGSNYYKQELNGYDGSNTEAQRNTNARWMWVPTSNLDSDAFGGGTLLFPDAFSTRSHKSFLTFSGANENLVNVTAGRWADTSAISAIKLTTETGTNWSVGSTFEMAVVDEAFNIDEQILGSDGTFSVGSISAADGDLVCIGNLRTDRSSTQDEAKLYFNGDTSDSNYTTQRISGSGTWTGANSGTTPLAGRCTATNAAANVFGAMIAQVTNFSDGSNDRNRIGIAGYHQASDDSDVRVYSSRQNNTAAITSLSLVPDTGTNFETSSMLSTYAVPKGLITRTELGSDTSSVTFSSIPATYDHLEVSVYTRTDRSAVNDVVNMTFNTDTTAANYNHQELQGAGSTLSANTDAANYRIGVYPSASEGSNEFGIGTTTIYNYAKTDRDKHRLTVMGSSERVLLYSRRWEDTSAINQIVLTPNAGTNFLAGSVFTLRGITATPSTSDAANINSVVIGSIAAINSVAIASIQAMNGVALTGVGGGGSAYAGITWAADDTLLNAYGMFSVMGKKGALGIIGHDQSASPTENYMRTAEHDGSSWSTSGNTNARHGVSQTGGTQTAGVTYGGYTGSDESNVTEEYNGSTWATGNNMVQGTNGGIGGGWLQTAQLCSGGSSYNPTVRDISTTQTYDGTNWSNESVSSQGRNTGTSGENGSGLDSFLAASGSYDAGTTTDSQLFNQTAGTWTSKASASVKARYLGCGSDGTRVYKIGGVDPSASGGWILSNMKDVVESWVENSWTTENSLPASRQYGGGSGTQAGTGENCAPGGVQYDSGGTSSNKDSFYVSSAL